MMRKEINIKEKVLEGFLVKILLFYSNNFEKVESYLLKAGDRVTPKIIETLILEYFKVSYYLNKLGDTFSVNSMILLTKSGRIHIKYTDINLNADILQRIVEFLFENTEITFEDEFCQSLSEQNLSYVEKNCKLPKLQEDLKGIRAFEYINNNII